MSGLAGYVPFEGGRGDSGRAVAREMAARMPHRGPDGVTAWGGGGVGLAHLKLAVTPESIGERQPHCDPESGVVVVADVRLDDRDALVRRLGAHKSQTPTDVELLCKAYLRWGREAPAHLMGDYAFAVWDPREGALFAAVDPFGARTFYYHVSPGRFATFASEPKALLAIPEVPDGLDEVRLVDYLSGLRTEPERTIFEAVKRLPAAHALTLTADGARTWRHYDLVPATGLGRLTGDAGVAAFRERFEAAVRDRVRTPYPVGSQLSGGLDSSAISALASRELASAGRGPLHTFTLTFDETPESDERPFAYAVLAAGEGYEPHFVSGDAISPLGNVESVYETLEEGLVGGTQHHAWALLQAAGGVGVRVLLDGFDGDTVVDHGTAHLQWLAAQGTWDEFSREAGHVVRRYAGVPQLQDFEAPLTGYHELFNTYGWPVLVEEAEVGSRVALLRSLRRAGREAGVDRRDALRKLWRRLLTPRALHQARRRASAARRNAETRLVAPAFAERVGLADRQAATTSWNEAVGPGTPMREQQLNLLRSPNFAMALTPGAHLAAAHGFDLAHPFFDRRVVELCLALPPEQSFAGGWTRYVLRKALEDVLPEAVAWRVGKARMTPTVERALREYDQERLQDVADNPGWLEGYLNMDELRRMVGRVDRLSEREMTYLAWVATAVIWLRRQWPDGPARPSSVRGRISGPRDRGVD